MMKKIWGRMKFLNIWNWAQLGVMTVTVLSFGLSIIFSLNYATERLANLEIEKNSKMLQNFMQENSSRLLDAAEKIAHTVESENMQDFSQIKALNSVSLVGNKEVAFDLLMVIDKNGKQIYCANRCPFSAEEMHLTVIEKSMHGNKVAAIVRVPGNILKEEGLTKKAQVKSIDGSGKKLEDALLRMAAVPYYKDGKQAGIVIIGILLNNNSYMPDWYGGNVHGTLSVFLDGYRVTTNLYKNNVRQIGTRMPPEVYNSLYLQGKPFVGKVALDSINYARYDFLYDINKKPIGVIGIAQDYGSFSMVFRNVAIVVSLLAFIWGILMIFGLRKLNDLIMRPVRKVSDGALRLANSELSYRVPIEDSFACWQMLSCKSKTCPAYGRIGAACWLEDHTMCTGEYLTVEEKLAHCSNCEVYLFYSKNEIVKLEATFNYMASVIERNAEELHIRQKQLYELIASLGDYESVVLTLALAVEAKDPYTKGHSERVSNYALILGTKYGISKSEIETLRVGTILHDIGKIAVGDEILRKNNALTKDEYKQVKEHPLRGTVICANLKLVENSLPIIHYHHERYDGNGYPEGLKGGQIPLLARITAIADAFDAMTSDRPYRNGISLEMAIEEIRKNSGTQFDPKLAQVFIEMLDANEVHIV